MINTKHIKDIIIKLFTIFISKFYLLIKKNTHLILVCYYFIKIVPRLYDVDVSINHSPKKT